MVAECLPQMLHGEFHRRQGVFDLVRDLTRHFSPRQFPFGLHQFIAAAAEVARHRFERLHEFADLPLCPGQT